MSLLIVAGVKLSGRNPNAVIRLKVDLSYADVWSWAIASNESRIFIQVKVDYGKQHQGANEAIKRVHAGLLRSFMATSVTQA